VTSRHARGPGFLVHDRDSGRHYYLYTPNLDHLSNDAENFGGQLTEVRVH